MNEAYGRLLFSRKRQANGFRPIEPQHGRQEGFAPRWDESFNDRPWEQLPNWDELGEQLPEEMSGYLHNQYDVPSSRHPQVNRALTSGKKQAWQGWGPSKKALQHKVAGWDWDDYQNGFLSTAHRDFQCSCGEPVKVPDYHNCKCGKVWNTYIIGTGGGKKNAAAELFIAREIPVRDDVIVANKKKAIDLQSPHYDDYSKWENDIEHQRATEENPFPTSHKPKVNTGMGPGASELHRAPKGKFAPGNGYSKKK